MCDARLMPQVNSSRMDLPAHPSARPSPPSAAGAGGTEIYTPKLKKVLKSYQAAATTSLMGPTNYQSSWSSPSPPSTSSPHKSTTSSSSTSSSTSQSSAVALPATKVPLIVPPDESRCEWDETLLNGEVISCFVIGGEMRLCLPQVLNSVLKNSIEEINNACTEMQIFCSRCTPDQLAILKRKGILPVEATSCGLITKTDAERLVAALVDGNPPKLCDILSQKEEAEEMLTKAVSVAVYHNCFGKTRGLYRPDLYSAPMAKCIECLHCGGMFAPAKFVAHSHAARNRTCLWGFDSLNWRSYLLLAKDQSRANNCATDASVSPKITGCCAAHRSLPRDRKDGGQEELDRLLDHMRMRFDLNRHIAWPNVVATVNGKLNPVSSLSPPAKRKEKEVSESANRDEKQSSSPTKRLKALDPQDLSLSSVPSFLPPHHMFYPNLLPIWSSYPSAAHLSTHHSLPEHLFQLSYSPSTPHPSPLSSSAAASAISSRHDQQQQLHHQSDSESQRDQVHRVLHKLTTLLVTLPQNDLDEVCSSLRMTLDRIQGPSKEVRRHSASIQQRVYR